MFNAIATFTTDHLQSLKTAEELWIEKVNKYLVEIEEKPRNLPLIASNRLDNNSLFVGGAKDSAGFLMQGSGYGGNPNTFVLFWTNPVTSIKVLGIDNARNVRLSYSGFVTNSQGSFTANPGVDYDVLCYLSICLVKNQAWQLPTINPDVDYIPLLAIPLGNAKFTTATAQYTNLNFNGSINLSDTIGGRSFTPARTQLTSDELDLLLSGQYAICSYVSFWYAGNPAYANPAVNTHINSTFFNCNVNCNLTYTASNITA